MAQISRGLKTPEAVTSYFEGKRDRPAFSWLDVYGEEHANAFTVAKAIDAELLGTFRRTIGAAIADSGSFETWRAEIQDELQRTGWWGPRRVGDPSGGNPERIVDFSSRRRLETIFWPNMRSARAAGQWDRIQRTKRALPYILYVRTASAEPRSDHLRFVGIILPVDHPFWASHFPPNGWGCKCSVRQITRREAEQLLGSVPDPDDETAISYTSEVPDFGTREFVNRRTGEVRNVPVGIDPGWEHNPGILSERRRIAAERASDAIERDAEAQAALPSELATAAAIGSRQRIAYADELVEQPAARRVFDAANGHDYLARTAADVSAGRHAAPIGILSEEQATRIGSPSRQILLSVATAAKQLARHPDVQPADYAIVQRLIEEAAQMRVAQGRSLEAAGFVDGIAWFAALKIVGAAEELFLTSLHRMSRRQIRRMMEEDGGPGGS